MALVLVLTMRVMFKDSFYGDRFVVASSSASSDVTSGNGAEQIRGDVPVFIGNLEWRYVQYFCLTFGERNSRI